MKRHLARCATVVAAILGLGVLAPTGVAAADDEPLPVPYSFLPNAAFGGLPGANAPGTNDWSCRPTARHPRPVVLVHGLIGNRSTNWQTYGPLLKNNGYCVFALTYGVEYDVTPANLFGGVEDMRRSAGELKTFVDRVLRATGARRVDLVGHSEGTVMPQWYLKFLGGATKVRNYVGLASAYKGTSIASIGDGFAPFLPDGMLPTLCKSCLQFSPNSGFMRKLHQGGLLQEGVRYTSIVTKYDELVLPYTNGTMKGVKNIVLQDVCPQDFSEHFQIASSRNAARLVLNALDPAHSRPVSCALVLPFVGELIPGLL
ncbi:esterase/lipase family protein [Nocardioides caeni]|uniref:Lipase n=1 Tax=Nocardioides caeni TaxID=574700 RepID=A0A4S8N2D6_9ACTN|nr:alpha/beta fold hydrolase [Nocardioides caeni]THV08944.1 lipase [Nocardioides caeni]